MICKFILALIFTLPSLAIALDLEGYYITAKGGVSKTMIPGDDYASLRETLTVSKMKI